MQTHYYLTISVVRSLDMAEVDLLLQSLSQAVVKV